MLSEPSSRHELAASRNCSVIAELIADKRVSFDPVIVAIVARKALMLNMVVTPSKVKLPGRFVFFHAFIIALSLFFASYLCILL